MVSNLSNNPFVAGLSRMPYEEAQRNYGSAQNQYDNEDEIEQKGELEGYTDYKLDVKDRVAYFAGRTIRALVSLPLAIIDTALRVVGIVNFTIAALAVKLETKCRNIHRNNTICKFLNLPAMPLLIFTVFITNKETQDFLSKDCGLDCRPINEQYMDWLHGKLYDQPSREFLND